MSNQTVRREVDNTAENAKAKTEAERDVSHVSNLRTEILNYHNRGHNIVPLNGKRPLIKWSNLHTNPATEEEILNWFSTFRDKLTGVGLITGLSEGICVLDLEKNEDPSRFELPDTPNARSGGGGWHFYFKIPDGYNQERFPTVDLRKHGIVGELRADGAYTAMSPSIHPETGSEYKWVIPLDSKPLASIPDWLLRLTKQDQRKQKDWQEIMQVTDEGERHTRLVSIAGKLLHHIPKQDWTSIVNPLLHSWNTVGNNPPLEEAEVNSIYESLVKKKHPEKMNLKKERQLLTVSDVLNMPESEKPKFLVYGLVPEKGITAVSGHPGCGKSWFMLSMAKSIATGEPFLDYFRTEKTNVLIVDEESGIWEMRRRMELLSYSDDIPVYFYSQESLKVDDDDDIQLLIREVEKKSIGLVIIDPFVAVHSGVENSAEDAQAVMEKLQLLNLSGAAVLFIHHHRKGMLESSGQSLRGSSALSGRLDSHITVASPGKTETTATLSIEHVKSRRGKNVPSFQVTMKQEDTTSPVTLEFSGAGKMTKKDQARELILELLKQGKRTTTEIIKAIRSEADVGDRNIKEALKGLITDKFIVKGKRGKEDIYSIPRTDNVKI